MGLGLSIAERIARLLGHRVALCSRLGHGTIFALSVPHIATQLALPEPAIAHAPQAPYSRVLGVDNDPEVLRAQQALLSGWNCEIFAARTADEAEAMVVRVAPDLMLHDYHLDAELTGLVLRERLDALISERPTVVIAADHSAAVRLAVAAAGCQLLLKPLALRSLMSRMLSSIKPRPQALR